MSYIAESVHRARGLGRTAEAAHAWRELLTQTHVDEADYSDWARELAAIYVRTGRGLSAARGARRGQAEVTSSWRSE